MATSSVVTVTEIETETVLLCNTEQNQNQGFKQPNNRFAFNRSALCYTSLFCVNWRSIRHLPLENDRCRHHRRNRLFSTLLANHDATANGAFSGCVNSSTVMVSLNTSDEPGTTLHRRVAQLSMQLHCWPPHLKSVPTGKYNTHENMMPRYLRVNRAMHLVFECPENNLSAKSADDCARISTLQSYHYSAVKLFSKYSIQCDHGSQ